MPLVNWIVVDEADWVTGDPDDWDGKAYVWFNNNYTKKSIKIPLMSVELSYVRFTKNPFLPPAYFMVNTFPVGESQNDCINNFDEHIGYIRFSEVSGFGVAAYEESSGYHSNGTFAINFDSNSARVLSSASSSKIDIPTWEQSGAVYMAAYKDESNPNNINGYVIGFSGPIVYDGNQFLPIYYGPSINNFPFSHPEFFPNGYDGITITETEPTYDPFGPGGESGPGGGGGSFDNTSTPIEIPNLPSISAASTGFISLFNPSLSQLNDLASYLWSDLFEIDGWKKLFADPMDAILGLSILPVTVPSGGAREVKVGNIGTGISLTVAASQFVEVDCGSIDVNEYWGAYLDYEPYTQAQIFLPYIGTRPISVDEIMGKTVRVVYHVDILTGACCCFVKCGDSVLYTYNGQCSIPIPITGANYTSVVNGVISIASSVGSLVATGGASAPTAVPSIASSVVNQMKPQIEKSGSVSGSAGVLNMQIPYLILIRPRQALPSKQNEFIGYPSLITVQLTELTGYTEVQSIHLENIPATQEELVEIQSLLEGGVIF